VKTILEMGFSIRDGEKSITGFISTINHFVTDEVAPFGEEEVHVLMYCRFRRFID